MARQERQRTTADGYGAQGYPRVLDNPQDKDENRHIHAPTASLGSHQRPSRRCERPTCGHGFRYFLALMLLILITGCATVRTDKHDEHKKSLLDQIWQPLPPLKRVLNKQDQEYAEALLVHWLETYLRGKYEVTDQEFFWVEKNFSAWAAIGGGYAALISGEDSPWKGIEIREEWYSPSSDQTILWKVEIEGEEHYFAVAATETPVPGARNHSLIGRFQLKKSD